MAKEIFPKTARGIFRAWRNRCRFSRRPLVAKPGAKFNYSTYGYTLLGCVLEGAASEKYVDFVKKNAFNPREWSKRRPMTFLR